MELDAYTSSIKIHSRMIKKLSVKGKLSEDNVIVTIFV